MPPNPLVLATIGLLLAVSIKYSPVGIINNKKQNNSRLWGADILHSHCFYYRAVSDNSELVVLPIHRAFILLMQLMGGLFCIPRNQNGCRVPQHAGNTQHVNAHLQLRQGERAADIVIPGVSIPQPGMIFRPGCSSALLYHFGFLTARCLASFLTDSRGIFDGPFLSRLISWVIG